MKYAIVQTSGKQVLVKPGQWYDLDLIKTAKVGDCIYLNKVLFLRSENKIQIGQPFLDNCKIPVKVIQQVKGADASKAREVKLDIQNAKRLAFTLGEVMTRLNGDLEALLVKQASSENEVIEVKLDGGSGW